MNPQEVRALIEGVIDARVFPQWYLVLLAVFVAAMLGGAIAWASSYLQVKAQNFAKKEDFDELKRQLEATTRATEAIKADIAGGLWVEQSRWTFKAGFYKDLTESLGVLASSLNHLLHLERLRAEAKDQALQTRLQALEADYDNEASAAFGRIIKCEAVARAWLSPEAQKALDTFADDWRKAWVGGTFGIARTQQMHSAAVSLHALLCSAVQADLQLRKTT